MARPQVSTQVSRKVVSAADFAVFVRDLPPVRAVHTRMYFHVWARIRHMHFPYVSRERPRGRPRQRIVLRFAFGCSVGSLLRV